MEPSAKRPKRTTAALSSARVFNTDSPITKQNSGIQAFLSACLINWAHYTEQEKLSIISTIPAAYRTVSYDTEGKVDCPITSSFVSDDKVIRDQIARFKREVADGSYTKTWQEKAKKAVEERASGKFNEYLKKHTEDLFADTEDTQDKIEPGQRSSDGEFSTKAKGRKRSAERQKGGKHVSRALATMRDVEDTDI